LLQRGRRRKLIAERPSSQLKSNSQNNDMASRSTFIDNAHFFSSVRYVIVFEPKSLQINTMMGLHLKGRDGADIGQITGSIVSG